MKFPILGGAAFLLSGAAALAAVAMLSNGNVPTRGDSQVATPADVATTPVVFSVPDMHCEFACAPTVRKTLAAVPGVRRVETDVENQTATVYAADGFDETKALAALVAEGYPGERVAQ